MQYSLLPCSFGKMNWFFLKAGRGTCWEVPVGSSNAASFSQSRGVTPAARCGMLAEHLDLCQPATSLQP